MKNSALILGNKKDQVLAKVGDFKAANLARERKAKLEAQLKESRKLFTGYFVELAWKFFKISESDLKTMDREELTILAEAIAQKAKPRMVLQQTLSLLFILPFVIRVIDYHNGTIYYSWYYLYHRKILREADNGNYFPQENLLKGDYRAGYESPWD